MNILQPDQIFDYSVENGCFTMPDDFQYFSMEDISNVVIVSTSEEIPEETVILQPENQLPPVEGVVDADESNRITKRIKDAEVRTTDTKVPV